MQADLDAFLDHLRSERQVSVHTLDGYRRDLGKVLAYCEAAGLLDWHALDTARLRRLIAGLHLQGQSGRSLARLLSAVRGLYRYLLREGRCQHDPAADLRPPKGERRLPRTLDADRAQQLLDGAVEDDFLARRDQAILELFYSSGLRLSELVGLDLERLDLTAGLVRVQGKGNKARELPIGSKAREALQAWLPLRALFEMLLFFPEWFLWGLPGPRQPRRAGALGRGGRKPLHESIFSYAFGPPRPPRGLVERDRAGAELIRHFGGVLATTDVIATTGLSRYDADEWLGRLLGRFGGDVDVTDEGEILYRFGDVARSAAGARRPDAPPLERPLQLTGNKPGTNALVAGLSAFVLGGSIAFALAMSRLGLDIPAASWGLVYVPGFVGATLLALPPLRHLAQLGENASIRLRNLRRLTLATAAARAGTLDTAALQHIIPDGVLGRSIPPAPINEAVRSLAAEYDGEPVGETPGRFLAPAIPAATQAAERARSRLQLDRPTGSPVVFTTGEEQRPD